MSATAAGRRRATGRREIRFEVNGRTCAFTVRRARDPSIPSVFFVGLPKAGSTLLGRLMNPLTTSAGLVYVAPQEIMFGMGVATSEIPVAVWDVFEPQGYAFGGFRSLPAGLDLPPYASGRTVVLVRDPRDMLISLYFSLARSHRPPGERIGGELAAAFLEARREVALMDIDTFVLDRAAVVVGQFRTLERKLSHISHRLYRYEDVIFDKKAWADDMLGYLGLSVSAESVRQSVVANDVRPSHENPAEHIRKVAPGDHIEKLRPQTIAALDRLLAPILRRHHYA